MTQEPIRPIWSSATPPAAIGGPSWQLESVAQLPGVRADLRSHLNGSTDPELRDRLVLALDELTSNALRHGNGGVRAAVSRTRDAWLLDVADSAADRPPAPAVGRDPSEGGLGLYLIAELASAHGWYVRDNAKHVWAILPDA